MKQYTLRFETNIIEKKGTTVRLTREAQLSCGDETILTDIKNFLDNVKLIYKEIQKCYKEGRFCEIRFDIWYSDTEANRQQRRRYDEWNFKGYPEEVEGIYLQANTNYTPEEKDLYLTFKTSILDDVKY